MEKHSFFMDMGLERYKKTIFMLAGAGFLGGIVLANTFFRKMLQNMGLFGDYFFMQIGNVTIESKTMFLYVFEKRMLFLMVVVLAAVTAPGITIINLIVLWIGLGAGILLSTAAIQQGMEGIVLCLAGLLPHYLLYIPAGIVLLLKSCQMSRLLNGKEQHYSRNVKKDLVAYLCRVFIIFIVFFCGIFLESYLNPVFLQKIYKIFNNM